jgi:hypothetical protein
VRGDERYFLFLHTYAAHNPYGGYDIYRKTHPDRVPPSVAAIAAMDEALRRP